MTEIIDLESHRLRRDVTAWQRDKLTYTDDDGVTWFRFGCHYTFETERGTLRWCFDIWATSWEDAEARLKALKETAIIDGPICEEIEV
jgi:hypothetical protein